MSRHGYTEDEPWDVADMLRQAGWRQAVRNAIKGKRGQAFLRELRDALEAMPVHELAAQSFTRGGEVCALGSVMLKRGLDASAIEMVEDDDESEPVYEEAAAMLKIAPCMAAQIMYANDEGSYTETPAQRWARMRRWVERRIDEARDGA